MQKMSQKKGQITNILFLIQKRKERKALSIIGFTIRSYTINNRKLSTL